MPSLHEGKACDAVLNRLEQREGIVRQDVRFPERERHKWPIEMTCRLGSSLYAFEHTVIEPFEGHLELEAKSPSHFTPIADRVIGLLPMGEDYELHFPVGVTLGMKMSEIRRMQAAVVSWVVATAPNLPELGHRDRSAPIMRVADGDVPFEINLYRSGIGLGDGSLRIRHYVSNDLHPLRVERIRRAYNKKVSQLEPWRSEGARLVLRLSAGINESGFAVDDSCGRWCALYHGDDRRSIDKVSF